MGGNLGKGDKKKDHLFQVNNNRTYPLSKRGRRATVDGSATYLDLANKQNKRGERPATPTGSISSSSVHGESDSSNSGGASRAGNGSNGGGGRGGGGGGSRSRRGGRGNDIPLEQQLDELQLGQTIRGNGKGSLKPSYKGSYKGPYRSKRNSEIIETGDKSTRKKGSKLNLFNSLKSHRAPPMIVPEPEIITHHSPDDAGLEVESKQLSSENVRNISPPPSPPSSSRSASSSTTSTSSTSRSTSVSPTPQEHTPVPEDLCNAVKHISFDESEDLCSSSSTSSGYPANGNGKHVPFDFDNVIGYSHDLQRLRPRGRSVSDSLFHNNESRDATLEEIKRARESEQRKHKRFEEMSKILSQSNLIIDVNDLTWGQKIGEGAFSEVWAGKWNGFRVAIKKLKSMVDDKLFTERFTREVESLRKGNHPNVVLCFGVCIKPPCIITEFMGGGNLYDLLHKTPDCRLSTPIVTKMATDLAVGLQHLHDLSILHRDLTSLNILLDELGNVKISDFGLSREKQQEGSMTMTLGGICNPRWRPPEITKNLGHYNEKVDVYSFALVVWEMLTGEIPFANLDGPQAAAQVAYTNLRPVIPPTCPAPLKSLIERCWVDDASLRPDFKDIVAELKAMQFNNPMGFSSEMS